MCSLLSWIITRAAAAEAPALKGHVRRWKNAVWVEYDDLVEVRLLAHGAGEVLPCLWVHLHSHIVAVVRVDAAGGAEATGGATDFAAGRGCGTNIIGFTFEPEYHCVDL